MPAKKYIVALTPEQREQLHRAVASNKNSVRERTHARILLLADTQADHGGCKDEVICRQVRTSGPTIERVRQRFAEGGLEAALSHKPQQNRKRRVLDGDAEAFLIATTCSAPPEGQKRWSLRLLAGAVIEAGYVNAVSGETVRQTLKKTNSSPG